MQNASPLNCFAQDSALLLCRRKAQLTPAATQPTNFLAALRACASTAPEELQRLARDDREVALTLTACLADPGSCRLALTPLASGRTLAALAALGRGQRVAAVRASLQAQLQCGAAQRATYTRLLSSQRAQLLASVSNNPRPNGQAALARVLSQSLHQRRHVAQTRLVQPAAAAATGGGRQDLLLAVQKVQTRRRLQLIDLVQRQHRELKKAWRESRCDANGAAYACPRHGMACWPAAMCRAQLPPSASVTAVVWRLPAARCALPSTGLRSSAIAWLRCAATTWRSMCGWCREPITQR